MGIRGPERIPRLSDLSMPIARLSSRRLLGRPLAAAVLLVSQLVAAGRCDACAIAAGFASPGRPACGACLEPAEPSAGRCPGCERAGPVASGCGDRDATAPASPCRCQWEPRDEPALAGPHTAVAAAAAPVAAGDWLAADPGEPLRAAVARNDEIPRRPLRILLGVWRN